MSESEYEETLLASVVIEPDRQLALHEWTLTYESVVAHNNSTNKRGYHVGLFDNEGNAIATIARIESTTLAGYEDTAWQLFFALVPPMTVERARNKVFFDLGSGPERQKA